MPEVPDRNAIVHDAAEAVMAEETLGDGISHVRTTGSVAQYGGYGPDHDRLVLGVLDGDRFQVTGEYRIVRPDGQPLPATAHVVGGGADLHLLVDDDWLRLDIDDIERVAVEPSP